MKALVKTKPGPGIELCDLPIPSPGPGEVLVAVKACGICGSDLARYEWVPSVQERFDRGLLPMPRVLGHEPSGVVAAVGEGVRGLADGDRVALDTGGGCGTCPQCRRGQFNICHDVPHIGSIRDGALAEYVVNYAHSVYRIPDNISFEVGATLEVLGVSLHAIEISSLKPGDTVAVVGPGPIGLMAGLVARINGASKILVLGLERHQVRLEMARQLGFTVVLRDDKDAVQRILDATNGQGVDLLVECAGYLSGVFDLVRKGGEVIIVGTPREGLSDRDVRTVQERNLVIKTQQGRHPSTWERAIYLVGSGVLDVTPLITHRVPLDRGPDAFQLLLGKEAIKVLVTMG